MASAVPMCDERGAPAIAPSPVLPIRDVKLEAAPPQPCDYEPSAILITGRPRATRADVVTTGDSLDESWVDPQVVLGVDAPCASSVPPPLTMLLYPTAAHQRGVFRPPRA